MAKILALVFTALTALSSAQLAIRQEQDQQVPGMPGAGDIAICTATGECPVSLATSSCLGKIDPSCADELCGMENLGQCVACVTSTSSFGAWSGDAIQMLCPNANLSATNGTATNGTAAGNATATNATEIGNATTAGNATEGNATATGANKTEANATAGGNGTGAGNGTGGGNGTAPAGHDAGAAKLLPAAILGMTLVAGAMLV